MVEKGNGNPQKKLALIVPALIEGRGLEGFFISRRKRYVGSKMAMNQDNS